MPTLRFVAAADMPRRISKMEYFRLVVSGCRERGYSRQGDAVQNSEKDRGDMKGKLLFVSGAAVGYVLGTRAGRKRYEQIKGAAQSVWNTPLVQQGVDQVKGFALARVGTVSDAFFDNAKKLVNAATKQSKAETTITTVVTTVGTPVPPAMTPTGVKPGGAKTSGATSPADATPKADG